MTTLIELKNICKKYNDKYALKNINIDIHENDIYGIIGESGAGKSTLLRILNLLEAPSSGSIFIKDKNLSLLKAKELRKLRKKIGMIFQSFNLLANRNVEENIALPLEITSLSKKERYEKVYSLIKTVNLQGKEKYYPHQLSGGQKQRVGIARALANDPFILLCDEATSALDPKNTNEILELIKQIQAEQKLTVVLITHEMEVLYSICNKVAILENGTVIEQGSIGDILSNSDSKITNKFLRNSIHSNINDSNYLDIYLDDANAYPDLLEILKKDFNLPKLHIIEANIKYINSKSQGNLLIEIFSNDNQDQYVQLLKHIVNYLKTKNIVARII